MPEDKVTEALRFAAEPLSLSEPLREDGDAELGDIVEDRSAESPFEVAATALLPDEIEKLLAPLDERERQILALRFGLDRGEPRTLEEVGEHFNLTRERIRQIEARAMSKLRHPSADTGARDLSPSELLRRAEDCAPPPRGLRRSLRSHRAEGFVDGTPTSARLDRDCVFTADGAISRRIVGREACRRESRASSLCEGRGRCPGTTAGAGSRRCTASTARSLIRLARSARRRRRYCGGDRAGRVRARAPAMGARVEKPEAVPAEDGGQSVPFEVASAPGRAALPARRDVPHARARRRRARRRPARSAWPRCVHCPAGSARCSSCATGPNSRRRRSRRCSASRPARSSRTRIAASPRSHVKLDP